MLPSLRSGTPSFASTRRCYSPALREPQTSFIARGLRLYYRLGEMLAQSDQWPNWNAGDEFRAIRDASCAADAGGC